MEGLEGRYESTDWLRGQRKIFLISVQPLRSIFATIVRPNFGGLIGDYMSAVSHSTSRGMSIDHKHPVDIKGVPYILYPVYGAGNTSLCYIGNSSSSVKLAVVAPR